MKATPMFLIFDKGNTVITAYAGFTPGKEYAIVAVDDRAGEFYTFNDFSALVPVVKSHCSVIYEHPSYDSYL